MADKQYSIGLALGGGGARGFAHLGVMKALQEKGIKIDAIAGTSAGALGGVFLASGLGPEESLALMKENHITDYAKVIMPVNGLLSLENLEKVLKEFIKAENFEDLELPFIVTLTNLNTGKVAYVQKGPLIPAIQASASIPVLFSPVTIEGQQFVDGGLMDNLPVKPLKECCSKVIAVSISPVQEVKEVGNLVEVAARTFQLTVNNRTHEYKEKADLFIEPPKLCDFDILDTSHADELFEIGYEYVLGLDLEDWLEQ